MPEEVCASLACVWLLDMTSKKEGQEHFVNHLLGQYEGHGWQQTLTLSEALWGQSAPHIA